MNNNIKKLNHKWVKDVCARCGCKREYKHIYGVTIYSRAGISEFQESKLECIDWEVENSKTID